ncbi:MAG TPA: hypothetical protein VGR70_05700 [Stellaceae bacterium]|nr:hypothetical protein [Stellaceae bacterium]
MWLLIKEAIAIVSGLALIFYIPFNTRRIADGWVPAKFTGDAADYPAFYLKQATRFMWLGIGISGVCVALILNADGPSDWIPDVAIAAIWLVIAAMTYWSRRQIGGARS